MICDCTYVTSFIFKPAHDKTSNKTCGNSKDSDQPVHLPNMATVVVYPSLDGSEAFKGTYDQQRL